MQCNTTDYHYDHHTDTARCSIRLWKFTGTRLSSKRKKGQLWKSALFLLTVLIPSAMAVAYFGFIASDIYISESRYVVRSPQKPATSTTEGMFSQMGLTKGNDDSYVVKEYVLSRDVLKVLERELDIKTLYSKLTIDWLARFPGLRYWDTSFEGFFKYYQKHVGVEVDTITAVSILTVRAFDANEAQKINQKIVDLSEAFVNKLNERARTDLLKNSTNEVNIAKAKVEAIAMQLVALRTQKNVGEPERQVMIQQRLALEKDFADRQLAAAMTAMEQSRVEAIRQQVYIERVTTPLVPDYALQPERIKGITTTLVLGLVLWGILVLLVAGVKEHQA
jgi:capsular polysaccharide transport system permease protein